VNNMFPENSYSGTCSCGVTYLAPKGTLHCSNCLYKRIAELEKENQTIVEQHDMWKNQWHELNYSLLSRDLEQQLKILKEYANTCGILRQEPSTRSLHELIMDLEAKALKEQSE